jgi:hypothetical protein
MILVNDFFLLKKLINVCFAIIGQSYEVNLFSSADLSKTDANYRCIRAYLGLSLHIELILNRS